MESKPVSTKQKESLVIILIDNVPVSISTKNKTKNEKSSPLLLSYTLLLNDILIYNRNLIYRISILKMDLGITPPKTNKNCK